MDNDEACNALSTDLRGILTRLRAHPYMRGFSKADEPGFMAALESSLPKRGDTAEARDLARALDVFSSQVPPHQCLRALQLLRREEFALLGKPSLIGQVLNLRGRLGFSPMHGFFIQEGPGRGRGHGDRAAVGRNRDRRGRGRRQGDRDTGTQPVLSPAQYDDLFASISRGDVADT